MKTKFNLLLLYCYYIQIVIFISNLILIITFQNIKFFHISNNRYIIINAQTINLYDGNFSLLYTFTDNEDKEVLVYEEDFEMISLGELIDNSGTVLFSKNNLYLITYDKYEVRKILTSEITDYPLKIYPLECNIFFCYYIMGYINYNKELNLDFYIFQTSQLLNQKNVKINNISSINFSCHLMYSETTDYDEIFTCFYQVNNANIIIATNIGTKISNIFSIISSSNITIDKNNAIIKSVISKDRTSSYVCYINPQNSANCLIYNLINNNWKSINNTYLNSCQTTESSFHFEYFENTNEFYLYCFQSSTQFNLVILNKDFMIIKNNTYNLEGKLPLIRKYYLSSLIQEQNKTKIFVSYDDTFEILNCEDNPNILTTIFISTIIIESSFPPSNTDFFPSVYTLLPNYPLSDLMISSSSKPIFINTTSLLSIKSSSTYLGISSEDLDNSQSEITIIQEKTNKTKEEIIINITKIIENYEIGKIYEIFGNDYNIKISPINAKENKNISTYIDLFSCEDSLRTFYKIPKNVILTIFQIEIYNNNTNSLINQVEYAIFDDKMVQLNLTPCSLDKIKIYYSISNTSVLNITYISNFNDIDVDIFNIKDKFFNDICYPYSEGDSDLILADRIKDIYQNYSLCEKNCEYEKINLNNMTILAIVQ